MKLSHQPSDKAASTCSNTTVQCITIKNMPHVPQEVQQLLSTGLTRDSWGLQLKLVDKECQEATDSVEAAALGNGSFGYVFAVRHTLDEQNYALKVIDMKKLRAERDMNNNSKMLEEVKTLAKLRHGHYIARYFSAKEVGGGDGGTSSSNMKDWLVIHL